ncbi:MAG: tetratricopeptide repeat protein [Deltaproteobacteria bacterium]
MASRLEVLEQMIARGVNDPFPMYGLALEYRSAGRLEDAVSAFANLRAKFPQYVPQYLMCGQILGKLGRAADARAVLEAGIVVARAARDGHSASELEEALAGLA